MIVFPMKRKSTPRAFLIALLLFGGLIYLSDPVVPPVEEESDSARYRLQVELRGGLEYDHVLVADTLARYTVASLPGGEGGAARFELNSCCSGLEDDPGLFQWWAEIGFSKSADRFQLLQGLASSDLLDLDFRSWQDGVLVGVVAAHLPLVGGEGTLELRDVAFNVRAVRA